MIEIYKVVKWIYTRICKWYLASDSKRQFGPGEKLHIKLSLVGKNE